MYICNYCGRVLKKEYEVCPGCGGSSFKTKAELGEVIIKEPPEGGYKIDLTQYKSALKKSNIFIMIGVMLILMPVILSIIALFLYFKFPSLFISLIVGIVHFILSSLFGITIGIVLIIYGINRRKISKTEISRIEKLSKEGMLVKNMPYKIVDTGEMVLGKYYKCLQVNFKNSAGVEIPLFSDTKYDIEEKMNIDKTADLLIDSSDYSNYYIDYEIF